MLAITLAEFARQIGVTPATARQWKRRGKIIEIAGAFCLLEGLTLSSVPEGTSHWRGSAGESVTERDSVTLPPLRLPECDKPIESLSRLEVLERDNRILSRNVDALRDLQHQINDLRAALIDSSNAVLRYQAAQMQDQVKAPCKSNYTGPSKSIGESFDDMAHGYECDYSQQERD